MVRILILVEAFKCHPSWKTLSAGSLAGPAHFFKDTAGVMRWALLTRDPSKSIEGKHCVRLESIALRDVEFGTMGWLYPSVSTYHAS